MVLRYSGYRRSIFFTEHSLKFELKFCTAVQAPCSRDSENLKHWFQLEIRLNASPIGQLFIIAISPSKFKLSSNLKFLNIFLSIAAVVPIIFSPENYVFILSDCRILLNGKFKKCSNMQKITL